MLVAGDVTAIRLPVAVATNAVEATGRAPPAPLWQFVLAAAAGAGALAVLFGVRHIAGVVLIFLSAAAGVVLRRAVARYSANDFLQPFAAALLAGVIGGFAVRYHLSSSLRLVAVCPCMILVPGPHVLNGGADLLEGRIHLGASRLLFAALVVLAISTGLLLGLALLGVELPVDPVGRNVSLWQDMIAAGVAVAAYSVFFSTPPNMLPWPIAVGVLAHAVRWVTLVVGGAGVEMSALVACLIVGIVLTPVARRKHMPFAAIGFASVVSMMPGVFLFRMWSGLLQIAHHADADTQLIRSTIADAMTAGTVILAMTLGLIVPKLVIDRVAERAHGSRFGGP
jgi:uncharacterized membrane protein YjjB (DUF3815 family)